MAYIDMLSPDAYGRYNRKIAKLAGLQTAIYWSELLDISTKVVKKQKFNEEGFFKVDRKYIEERTTLELESQLDADAILHNMGVLDTSDLDTSMIRIRLDVMTAIIIDDNVKTYSTIKKQAKVSRSEAAANKKAAIIATMKKCISELDEDLHAAYESWVDSVYASGKGFLTKAKIQEFEVAINKYPTKQVKLDILQHAIQSGYTDPAWVINRYNQSVSSKTATRLPEQKQSVGINTDIQF